MISFLDWTTGRQCVFGHSKPWCLPYQRAGLLWRCCYVFVYCLLYWVQFCLLRPDSARMQAGPLQVWRSWCNHSQQSFTGMISLSFGTWDFDNFLNWSWINLILLVSFYNRWYPLVSNNLCSLVSPMWLSKTRKQRKMIAHGCATLVGSGHP